jgi:two-component system, OmpR family, alkaline phosphatase synthesis response regulator PhoP
MSESILLIEDEQELCRVLTLRLNKQGYEVDTASDGVSGCKKALGASFDLIILDITLPQRNGLDVCRDLRQAGLATPILMLTARTQISDKVVGLKLGADDYVTKPFSASELMARIEALLRRPPLQINQPVHQFGTLSIDLRRMEVKRKGKLVRLTAREFQLLRYLIERPGIAIDRKELLRSVWAYDADSFTRTVDVHIAGLRRKLEDDPDSPQWIVTIPGMGYRFDGKTK